MPFTYEQSTGRFSHDGDLIGIGYSGHGAGLDNPAIEGDEAVCPIPSHDWAIGPAHKAGHLGPIVMNLNPIPPFDALGRTLFRVHGDNDLGEPHGFRRVHHTGPKLSHADLGSRGRRRQCVDRGDVGGAARPSQRREMWKS